MTQGKGTAIELDNVTKLYSAKPAVNDISSSYALEELKAEEVRLVLALPENPSQSILDGQRAMIKVCVNEINPVRLAFLQAALLLPALLGLVATIRFSAVS